jgi:hypothetical protein
MPASTAPPAGGPDGGRGPRRGVPLPAENAIKFRRPGSAPRIAIGATLDDGRWVLSVVDAGIGIDPRDHSQIFELFQRVNRREDYDGIGMGLPVCRRLVEAYGGRVWVESRAGEGAHFFVSIPGTSGGPSTWHLRRDDFAFRSSRRPSRHCCHDHCYAPPNVASREGIQEV